MEGADIETIARTNKHFYLYFWNPGCPGTRANIHRLDSLSLQGENILIVSLRRDYEVIDRILSKTNFSRFPYYTIEANRYSNLLLMRQVNFIRDGCESCYEQYKDDLALADYLNIENGKISPVLFNEKIGKNILK